MPGKIRVHHLGVDVHPCRDLDGARSFRFFFRLAKSVVRESHAHTTIVAGPHDVQECCSGCSDVAGGADTAASSANAKNTIIFGVVPGTPSKSPSD